MVRVLIEVGRTGAPGAEDVSVEVVDVEVGVVDDSLVEVEIELVLVLVLVRVIVLAEGVMVTVTITVVGVPLAVDVRVLVCVTTVAVAVALWTPGNLCQNHTSDIDRICSTLTSDAGADEARDTTPAANVRRTPLLGS